MRRQVVVGVDQLVLPGEVQRPVRFQLVEPGQPPVGQSGSLQVIQGRDDGIEVLLSSGLAIEEDQSPHDPLGFAAGDPRRLELAGPGRVHVLVVLL